jgi:hypothetical protein
MSIGENVGEQAKLFVFDLNNRATEHWFKHDEAWQVSLVTNEERITLERHYYPTLSAKALPEILTELLGMVKSKLNLAKTEAENGFTLNTIRRDHLEYLMAFNPERKR